MKCQANKSTKTLTSKLKQAIYTSICTLRWSMQKTRLRLKIYGLRWRHFLHQAGICPMCWNHTHVIVLALLPSLLLGCNPAYAEINQTQAVKAIIGEAANQGLAGMQAVGEVIRRRGNLRGLYGAKREAFISGQPNWVHKQALRAWLMSESSNLTKNATHFENVKAFGRPNWALKMVKTAVIKDHVFYREAL